MATLTLGPVIGQLGGGEVTTVPIAVTEPRVATGHGVIHTPVVVPAPPSGGSRLVVVDINFLNNPASNAYWASVVIGDREVKPNSQRGEVSLWVEVTDEVTVGVKTDFGPGLWTEYEGVVVHS